MVQIQRSKTTSRYYERELGAGLGPSPSLKEHFGYLCTHPWNQLIKRSQMPTLPVVPNAARPHPQTRTAASAQPQPSSAAPSPQPTPVGKPVPSAGLSADLRKQIPKFLLEYESIPEEVLDENPLLNERSAAVLLGVSPELLKKLRQRNWGPKYIQYGENGPVRYEFATLMEFRTRHRIQTRSRR